MLYIHKGVIYTYTRARARARTRIHKQERCGRKSKGTTTLTRTRTRGQRWRRIRLLRVMISINRPSSERPKLYFPYTSCTSMYTPVLHPPLGSSLQEAASCSTRVSARTIFIEACIHRGWIT